VTEGKPRTLKYGKHEAVSKPMDIKLSDVLAVDMPPLPKIPFGYGTMYGGGKGWGVLGNDYQGDCFWAGVAHEAMLRNRLGQHGDIPFDRDGVLSDYHACTGPGDNGTNVQQGYSYVSKTGIVDSLGHRHKIDAYVTIPTGDLEYAQRCVFTFGAVGTGIAVPQSAEEQFYHDQIWDDVGDRNIVGYHYICQVGTPKPKEQGTWITWGERVVFTNKFYQVNNDEAWVPLSKEGMRASGYNHRHIDWNKLNQILQDLRK
jgi:hypothetical protein